MSKSRASLWIGVGAFLTALCLGVGVTALVLVLQAQAATAPATQVSAYLADVKNGDVEGAMKLDGTPSRSDEVLLTNKAYANVGDRITGYRILGTQTSGSTATVEAEITQKSGTSKAGFTLVRGAGSPLGLAGIENWKLKPVTLNQASVTLGAPGRLDATVAGVPLGWKGVMRELHVFPGQYELDVSTTSPWFTLDGTTFRVPGFGGTQKVQVAAALTQKGKDAAIAAGNAWLDACAASTVPQPSNCSFGLKNGPAAGETWTNGSWTVLTRPTLTLGEWDFGCRTEYMMDGSAGGCWPLGSSTPGTVTFSANYSIAATGESGNLTTDSPLDAKVEGSVVGFTDTTAIFDSVGWK
ncbi:hypothetical protein [Leifsonia poae]|uniref:hypothetical protein n=1 Tax=Leifsonia poae TaxID=110933 RepID=UPI001CBE4964|nr:hypothetical protein [Leifsonia poae]